jgi:hypothetical protein
MSYHIVLPMEDNAEQWHESDLNQLQHGDHFMDMKDNEVTLWKNDSDNPKAPAYKGKGLIDGKEKAASLWHNTSKAGNVYLKLKLEEPYNNGAGSRTESTQIKDEIPF